MDGSELTAEDLKRLLHNAAGATEEVDPSTDILDVAFDELGYDSLALLETAGQVEREYGVRLSDNLVTASATPREFLTLVNAALAGRTPGGDR